MLPELLFWLSGVGAGKGVDGSDSIMYGGSDDGGAVAVLNCLLMVSVPVVSAAVWC